MIPHPVHRTAAGVHGLPHSIFDQSDAESVAAQYDRMLDPLGEKLSKVAGTFTGTTLPSPVGSSYLRLHSEPSFHQSVDVDTMVGG